MIFNLISAMPEACFGAFDHGVVGRAHKKGLFDVHRLNPRDHAPGVHQPIDDRPFGGGDGMLSLAEPFAKSIESIPDPGELCILSPQGEQWSDRLAREFSQRKAVTLVCPRYGGMDHRLVKKFNLREISVGDYILSGGELAAGIIIDSVARHIPGVLGHALSSENDSFGGELGLEAPTYTRPREWRGLSVPEVLLSGDHKKIETFNQVIGFWKTQQRRPDLLPSLKPQKGKAFKEVFNSLQDQDFLALNLEREQILTWNKEWKWW